MCNKRATVVARVNGRAFRVDSCLRDEVIALNRAGIRTVGCCCGHGRYPKTIVIRTQEGKIALHPSREDIPRKRLFYRTDSDGFYFIPETHDGGE